MALEPESNPKKKKKLKEKGGKKNNWFHVILLTLHAGKFALFA